MQPRAQPLPAPGLQLRRHRQRRRHARSRRQRPTLTTESTNRDERGQPSCTCATRSRSTTDTSCGSGLRHTRLAREQRADRRQRSHRLQPDLHAAMAGADAPLDGGPMLYASWGQGYESDVAPNRPIYINRGQPLPALKSRQVELGVKGRRTAPNGRWPRSTSTGRSRRHRQLRHRRQLHPGASTASSVHRGVEAGAAGSVGPGRCGGGAHGSAGAARGQRRPGAQRPAPDQRARLHA